MSKGECMGKKTFYDVLEVTNTAGSETIRAAYDALSRSYSLEPDAHPSNSNRLNLVRTAYEVLSNPRKKALYDQRLASIALRGPPEVATPPLTMVSETQSRSSMNGRKLVAACVVAVAFV